MRQINQNAASEDLIEAWVNLRVWAVVGASNDRSKYGNRIVRALRDAGYRAYAVNPRESLIEGQPAYPTLDALPEPPDVVNLVVPPRIGLDVARQAAKLGLRRLWFQPGADSEAAVLFCQLHDIGVVWDACILTCRRS